MNTTSVADTILAEYGFGWDTNPYRIVDLKTNQVVRSGQYFSFAASDLKALRAAFDRRQGNSFKKVS